jgi:sulfur carrier protein
MPEGSGHPSNPANGDAMTIVVNGRPTRIEAGLSVTAALAALGWNPGGAGIAVALNGEVVPRGAWPATALGEGDRVEVLGATQGG